MDIIQEISEFLQKGRTKNVKTLVQQALDDGTDPEEILNEGLLAGVSIVGAKFKTNEIFVPEVLIAARTMNAGLTILEPRLADAGTQPVGKAVIGTVKGDPPALTKGPEKALRLQESLLFHISVIKNEKILKPLFYRCHSSLSEGYFL